MDNKQTTYFLDKTIPTQGKMPLGLERDKQCIASNCIGLSCVNCLFGNDNKKEFEIWIINQRLISGT